MLLNNEFKQISLSTYNKIWIEESFPAVWTLITVIPLLKHGENKLKISYRCSALINIVCKMLEKIMADELKIILEESEVLSKFQEGVSLPKI